MLVKASSPPPSNCSVRSMVHVVWIIIKIKSNSSNSLKSDITLNFPGCKNCRSKTTVQVNLSFHEQCFIMSCEAVMALSICFPHMLTYWYLLKEQKQVTSTLQDQLYILLKKRFLAQLT